MPFGPATQAASNVSTQSTVDDTRVFSMFEFLPILIPFTLIGLTVGFLFVIPMWRTWKRIEFIQNYNFPRGLYDKFKEKHPEFGAKEYQLVARALRQFFLAHLKSGNEFVSMPSQVTDDLWHEFILYTRSYEQFCSKAFGRFMHHTPAVVLSPSKIDNEGLRRVWWHSCKEENIDPRSATRLPLLFGIDKKLGIRNGFVYTTDRKREHLSESSGGVGITLYFGGDFSDSSIDGGTVGFGDSDSGGGDGGSDGGCGGGCGGD